LSKFLSGFFVAFAVLSAAVGLAGPAWATMDNTATVTGTPRGGTLTPANDSESVDLEDRAPALTVDKIADKASVGTIGETIAYSVTVTNSGNTTVTGITVSDTLVTLVCPTSGSSTIATLAPGAFEVCTGAYSVTIADFDTNGGGDGDIDNTASATGTGAGGSGVVNASDSAAVTLNIVNQLSIAKSFVISTDNGATGTADVGDIVTYTYVVTNTGNVTLTNIFVNDVHGGAGALSAIANETLSNDAAPLGDSSDATANNAAWSVIAPGDSVTFTATYAVTQTDVDNQ
jgi:uncharacterized repeat protein (TIGR01451 family)